MRTTINIALWQVLVLYGIGNRLLNEIKSGYIGSETYIRIIGICSEWLINILRQGCVMSS